MAAVSISTQNSNGTLEVNKNKNNPLQSSDHSEAPSPREIAMTCSIHSTTPCLLNGGASLVC